MKLKTTLLISSLLLSSALAVHCGDASSGIAMYASAKSGLVVRSTPSTNGKKLGLIPYRGEVTVLAQGDTEETISGKTGRWARIDYPDAGDQEAWVFGGILTASQPDTAPATVIAANGPREGMVCNPCWAYQSTDARAAAAPQARMATGSVPGAWMSQKLSPPGPFMCG